MLGLLESVSLNHWTTLEVEAEVNLRQSIGQSVLVSGTHLGSVTNFSFSLKLSLDSCGFLIL
jgi:hypothetical protein